MTAQIVAYGRIAAEIQIKTTSNGNNMAFTRMAVSSPDRVMTSVRKKVRTKTVRKIKSAYQNRTRRNSDKTSNSAGLSGVKKVRKMRKFRYENCAERNGQKCAVFRLIRGEGCRLLDDNDRRQLSDFA
ncbi:hypothetical protein LZ92_27400 [Salmonella enterica]|nr:hypothetical protein [Salmonella enterica subsp. enterica serovar Newport]EBP1503904.1 hypothetical protein [Salmonella enterica]